MPVVPHGVGRFLDEHKEFLVAPGVEDRAQSRDRAVEVASGPLVRAPDHFDRTDQPIGPRKSGLAGSAQLAPVVAEVLDVRNRVVLMRLPEPVEPTIAGSSSTGASAMILAQASIVIDGGADRAGRAVYLFERGRNLFQKENCPGSGEGRVLLRDLLDLGRGFPDPLHCGLGAPAEGVPAKRGANTHLWAGERGIDNHG